MPEEARVVLKTPLVADSGLTAVKLVVNNPDLGVLIKENPGPKDGISVRPAHHY